jgi:hypothetical protein
MKKLMTLCAITTLSIACGGKIAPTDGDRAGSESGGGSNAGSSPNVGSSGSGDTSSSGSNDINARATRADQRRVSYNP